MSWYNPFSWDWGGSSNFASPPRVGVSAPRYVPPYIPPSRSGSDFNASPATKNTPLWNSGAVKNFTMPARTPAETKLLNTTPGGSVFTGNEYSFQSPKLFPMSDKVTVPTPAQLATSKATADYSSLASKVTPAQTTQLHSIFKTGGAVKTSGQKLIKNLAMSQIAPIVAGSTGVASLVINPLIGMGIEKYMKDYNVSGLMKDGFGKLPFVAGASANISNTDIFGFQTGRNSKTTFGDLSEYKFGKAPTIKASSYKPTYAYEGTPEADKVTNVIAGKWVNRKWDTSTLDGQYGTAWDTVTNKYTDVFNKLQKDYASNYDNLYNGYKNNPTTRPSTYDQRSSFDNLDLKYKGLYSNAETSRTADYATVSSGFKAKYDKFNSDQTTKFNTEAKSAYDSAVVAEGVHRKSEVDRGASDYNSLINTSVAHTLLKDRISSLYSSGRMNHGIASEYKSLGSQISTLHDSISSNKYVTMSSDPIEIIKAKAASESLKRNNKPRQIGVTGSLQKSNSYNYNSLLG